MKLNKPVLAVIALMCIVQSAMAQKKSRTKKDKIEIGVFVGSTNYSGDLEENLVNINQSLLGYGGFVRYNFTNAFTLRFGMDAGTITDADAFAGSIDRIRRNLSFTTTIFDGYLAAEFYFAHISMGPTNYISPYLFAGAGVFHFNPQAQYKGVTYDLRPLATEGQGTLEYPDRHLYDPNQLFLPFGAGVRFSLSSTWFLGVECRINKTFTDYLDDVSTTYASPDVLKAQGGDIAVAVANRTNEIYPNSPDPTGQKRGTSTKNDWFYYTGFTLSHSFKPKSHCYSF
jgi:hypothetical protein